MSKRVDFRIDAGARAVHFTVTPEIMLQPTKFSLPFAYLKGIAGQVELGIQKPVIAKA